MRRWLKYAGMMLVTGLAVWLIGGQLRGEPAWLTQARTLLEAEQSQPATAEKILREQLPKVRRAVWRAQALTMLAGIAQEAERSDSLPLLDQAIAAARAAELKPLLVQNILSKSWLLGQSLHRFDEAEKLLLQEQRVLEEVAADGLWAKSQQALFRRSQGDLRGALELLQRAETTAREQGNTEALPELLNQRGTTMMMMGRLQEAEALLSGPALQVNEPCRRGRVLATQGWIFNLARQTLRPADPLWAKLDPVERLSDAEALLRKCQAPAALANALTNRAHAAAAAAHLGEVAMLLQQAQQILPQPSRSLLLEWEDLAGQVALGRHDWAGATQHYERLAKLGRSEDLYESVWLALVGLAHAAEVTAPRAALARYREAEEYLDHRALDLPLGAGRGTFLARFERGTAAYIDLLVQQGQYAEAVRVIRHARARGLWALRQLAQVNAQTRQARATWEAALATYRATRRELDTLSEAAARDAEGPRQRFLQQQQPERVRELLALLEQALDKLGDESRHEVFRRPQDGEVWLTCHPSQTPAWHCFAWDAGEAQPRHLALPTLDAQQLGAALGTVRDLLSRARRLCVIAYGDMRAIDVHRLILPADKTSVEEQLDVVYALDLPWVTQSSQRLPQRALLVFDPQGRLPHNRRAAADVAVALRHNGWDIVAQVAGVPRQGQYPSRPAEAPPTDGRHIRDLLGGVRLFHYGGHGDYEPVGGWGHKLRISDGPGLLLGDILTLAAVPEQVLLFGCNTGHSAEEAGGVEGLGLAQAFLLRGSAWVIATVREVSDQVAADMARAIYSGPSPLGENAAVAPDAVALLRRAKQRLATPELDSARLDEIGAFRVFVP